MSFFLEEKKCTHDIPLDTICKKKKKIANLSVRGDVGPESGLPAEGLVAGPAGEGSLPGVGHKVALEVGLVTETLLAEVALIHRLSCRRPGEYSY